MGTPKRRKTKLEKTEWTSVAIPTKTMQKVREIIPKLHGYASAADYVRDAVRRKLQSDQIRIDMEKSPLDD